MEGASFALLLGGWDACCWVESLYVELLCESLLECGASVGAGQARKEAPT